MAIIRKRRSPRACTLGRLRVPASVLLALTVTLLASHGPAQAGHMDKLGILKHTWDGVAIQGYDPVAYFSLGKAVKGASEFRHEWLGQEWHFSSAEHRDMFIADPVRYVPQYGGYCSESHTVAEVNPTAWQIVGGRLYLFFSEASARRFAADERAQASAQVYWQTVKDGLLK